MDPISATASIIGLLGAGAKICSTISSIINTGRAIPQLARNVVIEVTDTSACVSQVQSFLLGIRESPKSHQALLMLDEIVVVLSNCVIVFSELEKEVASLEPDQSSPVGRLAKWVWKEQNVTRLLQRLQSSKTSLNLMISTLTW